jgi:hypothetical protein
MPSKGISKIYFMKIQNLTLLLLAFLMINLSSHAVAIDVSSWLKNKTWNDYYRETSSKNFHQLPDYSGYNWRNAFSTARENNRYFFIYNKKVFNSFRGSEWRKITIQLGMNSKVKSIPSKYLVAALKGISFKLKKYSYVVIPAKINFSAIKGKNRKRRTLAILRYLYKFKKLKKDKSRKIFTTDPDRIRFEIYSQCGQEYEDCQERIILRNKILKRTFDTRNSFGHKSFFIGKQTIFNDLSSSKYRSGRVTMAESVFMPILNNGSPSLRVKLNYPLFPRFQSCLKSKNELEENSLQFLISNFNKYKKHSNITCLFKTFLNAVNNAR